MSGKAGVADTPGHAASLGDLLAEHGRELQSLAYLILRDRSEAEDALRS